MKKIIVFDMDGVLFDSIPFAEEFYIEGHPGITSEMYKELHTGNFHVESKKYSHLKIPETDEEREQRYLRYASVKRETLMFEGMKELLETLSKDGFTLVMNTNAFERNCLPLLENSGIKDIFDFIAPAELSKDKVEKFKLIENKYNVSKEDILFITDSLGDVRDADIAEIPTIAVTWGVHDKTFFEREKHPSLIGIAHSVEELNNSIKNLLTPTPNKFQ